MRKEEIITYCKNIGAKRVKSQTLANHNITKYEKGDRALVIHSSPYSEYVWKVEMIRSTGSIEDICSFDYLQHYFK